MENLFVQFSNWAIENGWDVIKKEDGKLELNEDINSRYPKIPLEYISFLSYFKQIISPSEKSWFLCEDDYNSKTDVAFSWNEFEMISLEAAKEDDEWSQEIISWWNRYLPIVMSVHSGYSFYAIDLYDNIGAIVKGREPEFEEVKVVTQNLKEFIGLIMSKKIKIK